MSASPVVPPIIMASPASPLYLPQPAPIQYADSSGLNSYWVYAGAITGAAILTAIFIAIVLKIQHRRRNAWLLEHRANIERGNEAYTGNFTEPHTSRTQGSTDGQPCKGTTAIPLVVVHPGSEVGVAHILAAQGATGQLKPLQHEGPLLVPVKRSDNDGVVTTLVHAEMEQPGNVPASTTAGQSSHMAGARGES